MKNKHNHSSVAYESISKKPFLPIQNRAWACVNVHNDEILCRRGTANNNVPSTRATLWAKRSKDASVHEIDESWNANYFTLSNYEPCSTCRTPSVTDS